MDVDQSQPPLHEAVSINEEQNLVVFGFRQRTQSLKATENVSAIPYAAAGQFADHERVTRHVAGKEKFPQLPVSATEMVNPYGRVSQNHVQALRRRRTGRNRFSVPPSAANRAALARAIRASRPIRTKAVFSVTPVKRAAAANAASSILIVVLMHIRMHDLYARVKAAVHGRRHRPARDQKR